MFFLHSGCINFLLNAFFHNFLAIMILHLDMDAFFASVEQMDNPSLKGKPVIIGGDNRGVVATASYEARKYGIHSAMPVAAARRLCPKGIFIKGRYQRYSEISKKIMCGLRQISSLLQEASIDEAYMDISGLRDSFSGPAAVGIAVKNCVYECSGGLTCSVGIAPVKFLAKICSDLDKPDGLTILQKSQVSNFILPLKIENIPGIGKHMAANLHSFGISTISDLQKLSRSFLEDCYGKFGIVLYERARGIDSSVVHENLPPKSESAECTFDKDIWTKQILKETLFRQSEKIAKKLISNSFAGRTITLKMKFSDFKLITRAKTLEFRTASSQVIYNVACSMLAREHLYKPIRLIGIGISGFNPKPEHLFLPGMEQLEFAGINL